MERDDERPPTYDEARHAAEGGAVPPEVQSWLIHAYAVSPKGEQEREFWRFLVDAYRLHTRLSWAGRTMWRIGQAIVALGLVWIGVQQTFEAFGISIPGLFRRGGP